MRKKPVVIPGGLDEREDGREDEREDSDARGKILKRGERVKERDERS